MENGQEMGGKWAGYERVMSGKERRNWRKESGKERRNWGGIRGGIGEKREEH